MTKITAERRKKSATVHVGGKDKYPVFSKQTARSALRLLNHAKPPLTASQKAAVIRKAAKFGVHPSKD